MALFKGDRKLTLFKGDRKPYALFKGDKQITGAVKTHLEGTDIVKWESPYKAEIPNVETEGLGKQDKLSGKNLLSDFTRFPNPFTEIIPPLKVKTGDIIRFSYDKLNGEKYRLMFFGSNVDGSPFDVTSPHVGEYIRFFYTGNKDRLQFISSINQPDDFEVKKSFLIRGIQYWDTTVDEPFINPILTVNKPTNPYEPYCGGIPAPNPSYPIEPRFNSGNRFKINTPPQEVDIPILRAIPNTEFKDTYDVQRGIITRRVEEMTLTGEEDWTDFQTSTWYQVYLNVSQHLPKPNYKDAFAMCAKFMPIPMDSRDKIDNGVYTSTSAICFNPNFVKTIYEWKLWLKEQYNKGTPLKIWYALKNPYEEKASTIPLRQDWNGQIMQTGGDCGYAPMRADVFTEFRR